MKFEDFIDVRDGTHDSPKAVEDGVYLLTTKGLKNQKIDFEGLKKVSFQDAKKINERSIVEQYDILLSMIGTVGNVYQERKSRVPYVIKNVALLKFHGDKLLSDWTYYYLLSPSGQQQINLHKKGSTQQFISLKDIRNISVDLPSRSEMKLLVKKLSVVNDKILLNEQINDNLSSILLLNLSQLVSSNNFKLEKISDLEMTVSDHVANGSFKSLKDNVSYFDNPNYALFVRNIDFKNNLEGNKKYIDKRSYNYLKKSHLFGGEVVISNVADVGSIHRVPFLSTPMVVGNNQIFMKSEKTFLTDYLYVYFQSFWGQNAIFSITSGSAQQKFNKTDFRSLEIPIPTKDWIQKNIQPYLVLQDNIFKENQSLKQIKSILLNKYF